MNLNLFLNTIEENEYETEHIKMIKRLKKIEIEYDKLKIDKIENIKNFDKFKNNLKISEIKNKFLMNKKINDVKIFKKDRNKITQKIIISLFKKYNNEKFLKYFGLKNLKEKEDRTNEIDIINNFDFYLKKYNVLNIIIKEMKSKSRCQDTVNVERNFKHRIKTFIHISNLVFEVYSNKLSDYFISYNISLFINFIYRSIYGYPEPSTRTKFMDEILKVVKYFITTKQKIRTFTDSQLVISNFRNINQFYNKEMIRIKKMKTTLKTTGEFIERTDLYDFKNNLFLFLTNFATTDQKKEFKDFKLFQKVLITYLFLLTMGQRPQFIKFILKMDVNFYKINDKCGKDVSQFILIINSYEEKSRRLLNNRIFPLNSNNNLIFYYFENEVRKKLIENLSNNTNDINNENITYFISKNSKNLNISDNGIYKGSK